MIPLAIPILGEPEQQALSAVINSGWLTMGEQVKNFEKAFAEIHHVDDAIAVSSCTAALHLSLLALGVGPGDEVLVPSLTFVATVNAVLYVGATPVFVDIESLERPHICLKDAKSKLTDKTKAIIVMHYAGYLLDNLPAWRNFADSHQLFLLEDAAHAPAIESVAQISDAAAFSFFSNKNMTTAEGGMVIADKPILEKVRSLRSHGMTTSTVDRHAGHAYSYDVTMLGYNYRIDELRAAMGICQLAQLEKWNERRRKLTTFYRQLFNDSPVIIPFENYRITAAHLLPALLPDNIERNEVMKMLRTAGIQSSIHYPPVHKFSYYQQRFPNVVLPQTETFFQRVITLPLYPDLTETDIETIVKEINIALNTD
ncbi:MAG: DegT/DnrJ/EryC1/StrS aminotransferase family protein [Thiomargarita sp.]|nr:DegT/DnrJ/EryC1/StrS aminotransferase family protein [Thiomargarita sp.]